MPTTKTPTSPAVLRLLAHSWADINYNYTDLADGERACITASEFYSLVEEIKQASGAVEETKKTAPKTSTPIFKKPEFSDALLAWYKEEGTPIYYTVPLPFPGMCGICDGTIRKGHAGTHVLNTGLCHPRCLEAKAQTENRVFRDPKDYRQLVNFEPWGGKNMSLRIIEKLKVGDRLSTLGGIRVVRDVRVSVMVSITTVNENGGDRHTAIWHPGTLMRIATPTLEPQTEG